MTTFKTEAQFEQAFIEVLTHKGWESEILKNKTEADLLQNWANILFENNRQQDRLNDVPLTATEMQQIIGQIKELKTPLKLNGLINGKTVAIKRDNPADKLHLGKEVSLKIYDRQEIAAGQSRYQIVQQPKFERGSPLRNDRRGDVLLLINGMPVIHVELKRSGVPVSQAVNQIEKYSKEGIFSGLFSLIQVFVAMEPNEAKYFANPGLDGKFNPDYQFNWADFNNEPMNHWKDIASTLLSIPMAHQLIGFYTVADDTDGVLKVMRSYQYYAANAISDKLAKTNWQQMGSSANNVDRLGGYIWHTTGSGKTMTSFKSAQLIAQSKDADKVVFLMDRIELGTQSLAEYRNFASDGEDVQATENTHVLITKLKSSDPAQTLIVSSIQKMSNIFEDVSSDGEQAEGTATNSADIEKIRAKRLVFIIDEAHRSTFGDMLIIIKRTFPRALFFGFTGTPIQDENKKKDNTTSDVFGNELHRYSIADGIRDGNVLGFDPYKVSTFRDSDIRQVVALEQAKADSVADAMETPAKKQKFNHFMNDVPMTGHKDAMGKYHKGIEDYIPKSQYSNETIHQAKVVEDILHKWDVLSQANKFHAIFATNSIAEAIDYYRRLKAAKPELKISALFDPNIDNDGGSGDRGPTFKGDGLEEIMSDYNARYGHDFDFARHAAFKKDLAARLAHKKPYERIHTEPAKQLDLLIVVDQMLTGFDSKWLNTLYLDKVIKYQNIIQAFSRTNRLFGPDKPHGVIRYYRYPHTMEQHINDAVKLYSGDRPIGLFVDRLKSNLEAMNELFGDITELFRSAGVENFEKLPEDVAACAKFAELFKVFNQHLEAAKVQGLHWEQSVYTFTTDACADESGTEHEVTLAIDEQTYLSLALRYKELASKGDGGGAGGGDVPFDISGYLTEIDTGKIDADYMNSRFDKFLKELNQHQDQASIELTLNELHKSFSSLTQAEQKYAKLFLHDLQRGDVQLIDGHSFRDYINDYKDNAENAQLNALVSALGCKR
jgi:type I restriction enzyme R subunit